MNRNEVLKKVAYLTDNINKKIRAFRSQDDLEGFYEDKLSYRTAKFDTKIKLTMESGFLTKSKKELGKLNDRELNQLYERLHTFYNNEEYGTVKKFRKTENIQLNKSADTLKSFIGDDKFNDLMGDDSEVEFMKKFIKKKEELSGGKGKVYDSKQVLHRLILDANIGTEEEKEETMRTVKSLERERELLNRNTIAMEGRRKNGNR